MMAGNRKLMFAMLLIVSTSLGSIGQLVFKIGVGSSAAYAMALYLAAGMFAYGISTVIYLYILGRSNLSWTYGFGGFSYIFAVVLASVVLGEVVTPDRWIGVVIIAIGTALIGLS